MGINVNNFDVHKAEEVLKTCPHIVRVYVKLLKEDGERWKDLTFKVSSKLREKS